MKRIALSMFAVIGFTLSVRAADVTTKISDVHLCCKGCITGAEKAAATEGVKVEADQAEKTVTLTGPDAASVQKAANALVAGGYFGTSSNDKITMSTDSGAKGQKVQSLEVSGVHLCCGKCVSSVDRAVKSVSGVKEHTAQKNAKSFTVTGDFNDKELIEALHNAGFSGTVVVK